jgi:hypothetical protein
LLYYTEGNVRMLSEAALGGSLGSENKTVKCPSKHAYPICMYHVRGLGPIGNKYIVMYHDGTLLVSGT